LLLLSGQIPDIHVDFNHGINQEASSRLFHQYFLGFVPSLWLFNCVIKITTDKGIK